MPGDFAVDTRLRVDCSNDDLPVGRKDIAAYLKCSVRNAQRLERRELPVNRIEGNNNAYLIARDRAPYLVSVSLRESCWSASAEGPGRARDKSPERHTHSEAHRLVPPRRVAPKLEAHANVFLEPYIGSDAGVVS